MLIRSQNGKKLFNLNNIDLIEIVSLQSRFSIETCCNKRLCMIGAYSTEEKALKVLDMIAETYGDYTLAISGCQTTYQPSLYQMPVDSEV